MTEKYNLQAYFWNFTVYLTKKMYDGDVALKHSNTF